MGSKKRRAVRRTVNSSQKLRYPLGELSERRHDLKENYLSKSKELKALQKKLNRLKEKVGFFGSCFGNFLNGLTCIVYNYKHLFLFYLYGKTLHKPLGVT